MLNYLRRGQSSIEQDRAGEDGTGQSSIEQDRAGEEKAREKERKEGGVQDKDKMIQGIATLREE